MSSKCCSGSHGDNNSKAQASLAMRSAKSGFLNTSIRIMQMDCPTEENLIRQRLKAMPEVDGLEFNLMQRVLTVSHAANSLDAVLLALKGLGFSPEPIVPGSNAADQAGLAKPAYKPWWPLALALVMALGSELTHWAGYPSWLQLVLAIAAISISGLAIYKKGWIAIINKNLNINALMSIAVTGAVVIGQWPEAAMVMVLFAIAEAIEARSLDHARNSVENLLNLAPDNVLVQSASGEWSEVSVKNVSIGSLVRVAPGGRIGLDGIITQGSSDINQAPITGESALQTKSAGDTVFAGTINGMGELHYKVTAASDDTMLARIIHVVHDAQGRKAPTQRFVDSFSQIYTPIVCVLALLIAVVPPLVLGAGWYEWVYRALVLLVIACPCALVISTPVAVVSALGSAAHNGVLVKGGVYLEQARKLKTLALDKTGTLTTGKPQLLEVIYLDSAFKPDYVAAVALGMASRSDHPVSQAIVAGLEKQGVTYAHDQLDLYGLEAVAGGGIKAYINNSSHFLGSSNWVLQSIGNNALPQAYDMQIALLQSQGKTVSLLASDSGFLALFVVADALRATSVAAVKDLHALGVTTVMLSGDNHATAKYIADKAGVSKAYGGLLPTEKLEMVEGFMGTGVTGMVGDGINDAPALAQANIGFAMGVIGSDAAIETADVALMTDDLRKIPYLVRLSHRTNRILTQNISCALGIKAVFIAMTLAGMATMWMAVFADVGASLIVLANSLRLLRKA